MTRRGWLLFSAMCVLWGMPYLLIKIAVEELTPAQLVLLRTGLAAVLLLPYVLWKGQVGPVLRHWKPVLAFAVLELAVPWWLLASAEIRLSSSLTGLLVAAVPLVSAFVARAAGHGERLSQVRLLGLALGFAGVGALVGFDVRGGDLVSVGQVALVVVCYATAPLIVSRWLADVSATGITAVSLTATAVLYVPFGAPGLEVPSGRVVVAVLVLTLACTVAALLAFFALIAEAGPQRALVITFVNPAVALLLGIWLLSEPLTLGALVGFPLIVAGCALATRATVAPAVDEEVLAEPVARS
jgi:drug/metabolite transporter (DMT)-like permease